MRLRRRNRYEPHSSSHTVKLCITEKPSVARDIAAILGATVKRDGYYEGSGDWCVTWTFGHLCTLKEPADYSPMWQRWSMAQLPMIPPQFGIKLIDDEGYKRQFGVIAQLASQAEEIVNCGDAGQEGELIQRWVMQMAAVRCPVKRLWISSLTDDSIREGFARLEGQERYDRLYHAGLSRAIGDWILGMNATRLFSLKYSSPGHVLSIGRVQTPTLALVVKRHHEIAGFKPDDYWELSTIYRDVPFSSQQGRFATAEQAEAALAGIEGRPFKILSVKEKKGREAPPRLFDLTSLQVEANKRWGWTAEETLRLIQSLYEKKVTTYPRVDTTFLTDDLHPKIPYIMGAMTPYANLTAPVLAKPITKSKKIFDNSKVTDHHAIIPTGQPPTSLVGDERHLYHLIALRFIAAFYPDCEFSQTTVEAEVQPLAEGAKPVGFKTTGKVILTAGWRTVLAQRQGADDEAQADDEARVLPSFAVGESGSHTPKLVKKATQPPKPYTEGTLLRAMETAGKTVDNEDLRHALKQNGIGRPSTRAAIIETLFKRGYIRRQRKSIAATQAGIDLIAIINNELLKSAALTGMWENKLRRIESGDYQAAEFLAELKQMVSALVLEVMADNSARKIQAEPQSNTKPRQRRK